MPGGPARRSGGVRRAAGRAGGRGGGGAGRACADSTGSAGSSAMRRRATCGPMPATAGWRPGRGRRGSTGPNCRSRASCVACRAATAGRARRDGFMAAALAEPCRAAAVPGVEPGPDPHGAARCSWPLTPARTASAAGGRRGLICWTASWPQRGEPYRAAMSSPLTGERACSRLSPHLALGHAVGARGGAGHWPRGRRSARADAGAGR